MSKGLNFATTHSKIDKLKFIAAVEPVIDNLPAVTLDEKNILQQKVATAVNCASNTSNITYNERNALKALEDDDSILVIPTDTGR